MALISWEDVIGTGGITATMLAGGITADKIDLTDDFAFTGAITVDGNAVADASQVGSIKVKAATTANITDLAAGAPNSLDGVALSNGNSVLVKNQSTASANGVYTVTSAGSGSNGQWTRHTSYNETAELPLGLQVYVQGGTQNSGRTYLLTAFGGTVGSDSLTFTRSNGSTVTPRRLEAAGDGANLNFDLATASTSGHEVFVNKLLQPTSTYTLSAGGGAGGVDRIAFGSGNAPPNLAAVDINYLSYSGA